MRGLTPKKISEILQTPLICGEKIENIEINSITRDSREAGKNCLFAAICGERVDGHDFLNMAQSQGALCAICEKTPENTTLPYFVVENTQTALGKIASYYRSLFDIPFIGITGSVGKTSAKEMCASVLSEHFETLRTPGNYNNELGVPLTLFMLEEKHQAAVIEMGISDFGEMSRLTAIAKPNISIITVVGYSHLEMLGDLDGVLKAKTEIVEGMNSDGILILNGDDEKLRDYKSELKTIYFGLDENCDIRAKNIEILGISGMKCDILSANRNISVEINSYGKHMVYAALSAVALGFELGLSDEEIINGVKNYAPVGRRSSAVKTDYFTIIDDCYNSNPNSAISALQSLSMLKGRKVAILGDMLELGENADILHEKVGIVAAETVDLLVTCGKFSEFTHNSAKEKIEAIHFGTKDELIENLNNFVQKDDIILIKASRSMKFEEISEELSKVW